MPRTHPLRFRYDCARSLTKRQFARVDRPLSDSLQVLGRARWRALSYTAEQLARALEVVSTADDLEQAYIRRCGCQLTLLLNGVGVPSSRPLRLRTRTLTVDQIQETHAYVDPAHAGYRLAALVTGLPNDLLELIGGDQITETAMLGCPVPQTGRPILRALEKHSEPVLIRPRGTLEARDDELPRARVMGDEFSKGLAKLLQGRRERIRDTPRDDPVTRRETPSGIHARLDSFFLREPSLVYGFT